MSYRDLLSAEVGLFGSYNKNLSTRRTPGGEDRIDDLAQAWIDGDRERVLKFASDHAREVRSRPVIVKVVRRKTKKEWILELRKKGWSTTKISRTVGCRAHYVSAVCRSLPRLPRAFRKVDPTSIAALLAMGKSTAEIASSLGVTRSTVIRAKRRITAQRSSPPFESSKSS